MTVPQLEKYAEQLLKICSKPQQWDKDVPFKERSAAFKSHQAVKLSCWERGFAASHNNCLTVFAFVSAIVNLPSSPQMWMNRNESWCSIAHCAICVQGHSPPCGQKSPGRLPGICFHLLGLSICFRSSWLHCFNNMMMTIWYLNICDIFANMQFQEARWRTASRASPKLVRTIKVKKNGSPNLISLSAPFSWVILLLVGYCQGMENLTK